MVKLKKRYLPKIIMPSTPAWIKGSTLLCLFRFETRSPAIELDWLRENVKFNLKILILVIAGFLGTGCADLGYYLHSVKGQLSVMQESRDIDEVVEQESIDPKLKQRLQLVARIREFAFKELDLPESASYTRYADVGRNYVLKNLYATEEFSISLQRWCYPIAGCAGYRGYFDEDMLEAYKSVLLSQRKDVYVGNVPAYSTLGWFDDPVLNTFIFWPEERLAGLIFHELAHQRLYMDGDSQFNESFAMAVQQSGTEKWLKHTAQYETLEQYRQRLVNRERVVNLIEQARAQLNELYDSSLDEQLKRLQKRQVLQQLKQDYRKLSASFTVQDGFSHWFQGELNNAKLASVSTYYSDVSYFRQLLTRLDEDYSRFYEQLEKTALLEPAQRRKQMEGWALN